MRLAPLPLLAAVSACVALGDRAPYALIDATTGDDDSGDDDSSGDDDTVRPCDTAWLAVAPDPVSLAFAVEPLLFQRCAPCHTSQELGGMSFVPGQVRDVLVDVPNQLGYGADMPRVTASEPEASYLLHKVMGCSPQDPVWGHVQSGMPPPVRGAVPLTHEEINVLYSWVAQGANP